jgi:hypothetical protein
MTLRELFKLWRLKLSETERIAIAGALDGLPTHKWSVKVQQFADIVRGIK